MGALLEAVLTVDHFPPSDEDQMLEDLRVHHSCHRRTRLGSRIAEFCAETWSGEMYNNFGPSDQGRLGECSSHQVATDTGHVC
jgi:hypothetical protein